MSELAAALLADIAAHIAALPMLNIDDPGFQEQGEQIARLCVNYSTFNTLDAHPGAAAEPYGSHCRDAKGGEWHIKLRRARNSCTRFFEVLNEGRCDYCGAPGMPDGRHYDGCSVPSQVAAGDELIRMIDELP